MARLEVVSFSGEHLEDAGRLLAARHARQREVEPLLPPRFEDPGAAQEEVAEAWSREGASGTAAFRGGRLVGYLVAAPREGAAWGENVWVEPAGHAVEDAEDVRALYAAAAGIWVEGGRRAHYALVPATDAGLVDAWFRLGFGHQQAHGVREVPADIAVRAPEGLVIRAPREEDVEALLAVDVALPRHQRSSPVFSGRPLPTDEELRAEWRSTLADDDETILTGWLDGRPVAVWSICAAELSSHCHVLMLPDRACYLGFASTLPEHRGAGVGVALTDASFAAAAAQGYEAMVTDWRVTNLLASRFWPRRGFRPVFFRLCRVIPG